jgi:molybdopterin-guanine dinucleotide biosynthesis protein A
MGRDKAGLDFGGVTLASRLIETLRGCASEVFVVGRGSERFAAPGVTALPDAVDDVGPLGGLLAGLRAMSAELGIVVACDMPFLTPGLLAFVASRVGEGDDGAMIRSERGVEPLCAVYRKRLATTIEAMIKDRKTAVNALTSVANIAFVDASELERHGFTPLLWFNMNTPEDYEQAIFLWKTGNDGR